VGLSGLFANVALMARPEHRRRIRSRWQSRMRRAVANRRIFPYLLAVTVGASLLAGFLMTLLDREDFPTFGIAVWWAVQTLSTVGYGDVVPHSAWGRVLGGVVILIGVTFLSFLTAIVTSLFVSADQDAAMEEEKRQRSDELAEAMASLRRIEERLAGIEAKLGH
jgi:voltage-gated potassium channel